ETVLHGQHRAAIFPHRIVRNSQGKRIDVVINSPRLVLESVRTGQNPRARISSTVIYHSRQLDNATDYGQTAVARATVVARLRVTSNDQGLISDKSKLIIDFSDTTRDDITVGESPAELVMEVKDALFDYIQERNW